MERQLFMNEIKQSVINLNDNLKNNKRSTGIMKTKSVINNYLTLDVIEIVYF